MTVSMPATELRPLSVADYHRMAAVGILGPDEPVELLAGQILRKIPKSPAHSAGVKRLEKLLETCLGERALVRVQDPIHLNDYSEPEPDLAVVHPDRNFYGDRHPVAAEVYLLIEVADTSRERDLSVKVKLYAAAKIVDYWVLDLKNRQLHQFRDPQPDGYQSQLILGSQQSVTPIAFPDCIVSIQDCLP